MRSSSGRRAPGRSTSRASSLGLPPLGPRARGGRRAGPVPAVAPTARRDPRRGRRAARPEEGDPADDEADLRERLQEPGLGPGRRGTDRGVRAQGLPDRRRARLRAARELHRERRWCDERRRARADGRGATPRPRALRRRARARGALPRPDRVAAAVGKQAVGEAAARRRSWAGCRRPSKPVVVGAAIVAFGVARPILVARETSVFAVRTIEVHSGSPRVKAEVQKALAPELGRSLLRDRRGRADTTARGAARRPLGHASTARFRTRSS